MPSDPTADPIGGPSRTNVRTIALSALTALGGLVLLVVLNTAETATEAATGATSRRQPSFFTWLVVLGLIVRPAFDMVAWAVRTYTVGATELVIDEGLFTRHHRVVPFARVQQVDLHQPLAGQLLGIVEVRVSTAGEAGPTTVALRSLASPDAEALRAYILRRRAELQAGHAGTPVPGAPAAAGDPAAVTDTADPGPGLAMAPPPPERVLRRVSPIELVLAALTHSTVAVGIPVAIVAGLWAIAWTVVTGTGAAVGAGLALALLIAGFVLVTQLIQHVVARYGFTIAVQGDDLHLRYGLLEVRQLTIPRRRVQQITVVDNPLRRMLGAVAVELRSASGGHGQAGATRFEVPWLARADLDAFLVAAMGDDAWAVPALEPRPPRARTRAIRRRVVALALVLAVPAVVLRPVGLVLLAGAALGVPWGREAHRRAGHLVRDATVTFGKGVLHHRIELVPVARLQGARTVASPFQRRAGVATLHCDVAGETRAPGLFDVDGVTADELRRRLPRAATHAA